jgi:hypothetical protein
MFSKISSFRRSSESWATDGLYESMHIAVLARLVLQVIHALIRQQYAQAADLPVFQRQRQIVFIGDVVL